MNLFKEKIIAGIIISFFASAILFILISLIVYQETFESCLKDCEEKYRLNIDNSWEACDESCKEKFNYANLCTC